MKINHWKYQSYGSFGNAKLGKVGLGYLKIA
jgi:hypothetical protein